MNSRSYLGLVLVCMELVFSLQMQAGGDRFYVYNATNGLSDNSAQTIACTKSGRLVITTMGQINFFDGNNFNFIDPTSENTYSLDNYWGNYHLYFDRFHHMWLKNTHSVTCVNLTTERFVESIEDVFSEFGMEDRVLDLFVDHTNVVWLLTAKGLYNVASQQTWPVRTDLNLQDLEIYEDKFLMLFFQNGLLEITDMEIGKKVYEGRAFGKDDAGHYGGSSVTLTVGDRLFQIRNGQNEGILLRFDIEKRHWKTLLKTPYYLSNLAEKDSILYIPSAYGYWTYDLQTEELNHKEELTLASGEKLLTDINAMCFDKQGGMWIGTERRGLLYSRPFATPFQVYTWDTPHAQVMADIFDNMPEPPTTYRNRRVNCVYRDSRGWEWVGTSLGLQVYKSAKDNLPTVYTRKDGLLNNVIHTIMEDDMHNIWVGTSYGLCCLLIENDQLRYINSYNAWDNVPSESFVNGKAVRFHDGTISMQMLDHVLEFNPNNMSTINAGISYDIYPKLIRLMVNGNVIRPGEELDGKVILSKALSRTAEIDLDYNQNSVTLTFTALNYFRPQQTYYRVRINGLDEAWQVLTAYNSGGRVDSKGMLHLPMVALKPGTYNIEVQTSMIPDKWDTEPYMWVVNVHEPWWRTTGAMSLFGVVLAILLGINIYYYVKNVNMRAARNNQERGVVRNIRNFAENCTRHGTVLLEPGPEEYKGIESNLQNALTPEFIDIMEKIMPMVLERDDRHLTMRDLCAEAKMELQPFYQLMLGNIFKNPRPLAKILMLKKAEQLLMTTEKDMEEISSECGFVTPNYFIATFYREYRATPEVYRQRNSNLRRVVRS